MRVLLVTGSIPPMHCGVGDYTAQLARSLAGSGITVGVLTGRDGAGAPDFEGIEVFAVIERWGWRDLRRIRSVLRDWAPDVVHIQHPTRGYGRSQLPTMLPLLCRLWGLPVVQTWHEARRELTPGALFWLTWQWPVSGAVVLVRPDHRQLLHPRLHAALRGKHLKHIPNAAVFPKIQLTPADRQAIRARFGAASGLLVAYFGFIYPAKAVEQIFEIASPELHRLAIIGEAVPGPAADYRQRLAALADSPPWTGKVTLTGFLPADELARVIAAADAIVLPFAAGGGEWNTSIHGAQAQGTFVLTTSRDRRGYDAESNTYFAAPGDLTTMRSALQQYIGQRAEGAQDPTARWRMIAAAHLELYRELLEA